MTRSTLVGGVDSSTQSCKFVVVDASTGRLESSTALPHPEGTTLAPHHWWDAIESVGASRTSHVAALSVAAQQHTTVFLDEAGTSIRDALLWNDPRASKAARALRAELGERAWIDKIGGLPTAAHPVAKLRWLREHEPANADRVETVLVPHDWLTWRLLDSFGEPTTDRSDASGTGYWSCATNGYRPELLEHALGRRVRVPRVLNPSERAGVTSNGVIIGAGCGDNAAAILGLGIKQGTAVVSVGTSLTVSMVTDIVTADDTGVVASMADATGAQLSMVATLNGARTFTSVARMLGLGVDELDSLAATARPDAAGLTFLPYLDGERTPFLPDAHGALLGLTRQSMTPENLARAAVLALACVVASAIDGMVAAGLPVRDITILGGGARSSSLRKAVADLTGLAVSWPGASEFAALGAARQAAWALTGELPDWPLPRMVTTIGQNEGSWVRNVRQSHLWARDAVSELEGPRGRS